MIIYLATNNSPKYNLPALLAGGHDALLSYHYTQVYPEGMLKEFAVTGLHAPVESAVTKKFEKERQSENTPSRKRPNKSGVGNTPRKR